MYDENQVKQLVSRGIWVFGMVLVGSGSNDKRLRVWEGELGGLLFQLKHLHQRLLLAEERD